VLCWGSNQNGQLGIGSQVSESTQPILVPGLSGVVQIAGGEFHSCALLADGTVSCWGRNNGGQVGIGGHADVPTPTVVPGVDGAVEIALGYSTSCARRVDGTLMCWGGGLGDGLGPSVVKGVSGATSITVGGGDFACATVDDDTLSCWGDNHFGNLGDGTTADRSEPAVVSDITDVAAVGLGAWDSCIAHHDGMVECWGANSSGQLGDGKGATPQGLLATPTSVPGLTGVVALALGWLHTCALLSDGTERCWGADYVGQLGDDDDQIELLPTPVKGLSSVAEIAVGLDHSCAWRGPGDVECWGQNDKGQLGDGTTTFRGIAKPVVW
jgi:alpha-tubulin suppressor-like RCC1 family protein